MNNNNAISQNIEGNESGAAINSYVENPDEYELEPISNDFNRKFASVSLANDLWLNESFHAIELFKFSSLFVDIMLINQRI
jgi:hypothetical protein